MSPRDLYQTPYSEAERKRRIAELRVHENDALSGRRHLMPPSGQGLVYFPAQRQSPECPRKNDAEEHSCHR